MTNPVGRIFAFGSATDYMQPGHSITILIDDNTGSLYVRRRYQEDFLPQNQKISQNERVLNYLIEHGTITNADGHKLFGIRHLCSVIRNLKAGKHVISDSWEDGTNRYGQSCRFKRYKLEKLAEK